jgi:hypothetical protein
VLDPMPRYFSRASIVPDELVVDGRRLAGEDPRATAIATALRESIRAGVDPARSLQLQGVGWIVVDRDAGGPSPRDLSPALIEEFSGLTVTVFRIAGTPTAQGSRPWVVVLVLAAWTLAGAVLAAAAAGAIAELRRVRSRL